MSGIDWGGDPKKWQVGNFDWSVSGARIRDTTDRWGVVPPHHGSEPFTEYFPTHAEAVHYAQREALKAVAAKFALPPETLEPTC